VTFLETVRTRASASSRRLAFPESADGRTLAAATEVARLRIAHPNLVLDPSVPETHAAARATGLPVVDPTADPRIDRLVSDLLAARGRKG
jgi:phosphotransacetylase